MDKLEPPQAFHLTMYLIAGNFDSNILIFIWLQHKKIPRVIKTSIFLTCIDQKGREIYETFTLEPGDEMKLAPVLHKFSEYCNPRKKHNPSSTKVFHIQAASGSKLS